MRDTFLFYRSFAESMNELPPDDYKALMVALIDYAMNDITPESLPVGCKCMFVLMKPQIDANNRKYENGKKGGRKKKTPEQDREVVPMPDEMRSKIKGMLKEVK